MGMPKIKHKPSRRPPNRETVSRYERIAELEAALKSVRKDITTCGEIVWRPNGIETTFDYIGRLVNDPVTWDEWEARQIGADDE